MISENRGERAAARTALAVILGLHLLATCLFLPPWEALRSTPLQYTDHPVHTHRVHLFREALRESGLPWGYDPAVSAGTFMQPDQDAGARPQEVLGILLPFLSPGAVVRAFLFVTLLTCPLWTWLAARRLGIAETSQAWILLVLVAATWLYTYFIAYFQWGLVSFAAASYFSPYVLALFLNLVEKPGLKIYLGFCLSAALLLLFHIVSPTILVPALALYTLFARPLHIRWRTAIIMAPLLILAINFFWFYPCMLAMKAPDQPFPFMEAMTLEDHLTNADWGRIRDAMTLKKIMAGLLGLGLAIFGYTVLKRSCGTRVTVALALTSGFAVFVKFFGSFLPVFLKMQPVRFNLTSFIFLTFPVGTALAVLAEKARIPSGISAAVVAIVVAAGALSLGKPESLPLPPVNDPLGAFITEQTATTDRLLIQSKDGYQYDGYESKIFPMVYGREVIGSNFPARRDPAQFLSNIVWGRTLDQWTPEAFRTVVDRWGITWILTQTEEARDLVSAALGSEQQNVGNYHVFRVPGDASRMLIGGGKIEARVNRIELTELRPESDLIVLRYRYHPAWKTDNGTAVYQYPVPEDPTGFIALRNPTERVTLKFDPWAQLHAPWPEPTDPLVLSRN